MMNYDQRMAATRSWLVSKGGILERRTAPRRLTGDTADETATLRNAEVEVLARAIVRTLPSGLGDTAYRDALEAGGDQVEMQAETASWPTARDLVEAINKTRPKSPESGSSGFRSEDGGRAVRHAIEQGLISNLREARWLNMKSDWVEEEDEDGTRRRRLLPPEERPTRYFMTEEQLREARDQRPGPEEWDHHIHTLTRNRADHARLEGRVPPTVDEVEAEQVRSLVEDGSEGQLPAHLVRRARSGNEELPSGRPIKPCRPSPDPYSPSSLQ